MGEYTSEYQTNAGPDEIVHKLNDNSLTVYNNTKLEDCLNVITVHTNPNHFKRRRFLSEQFRDQMEKTPDVRLFIVELVYGDSDFEITTSDNPRHLQLRTSTDNILWHKENLLNIGIRKLLPSDWKCVAFIDADIEFDSATTWASHCLKLMNGFYDVMQLFNVALDMDKEKNTMQCYHSFAYQYVTKQKYYKSTIGFSHSGYAWSITRKLYDEIGGLFQFEILGSGDYKMCNAFVNRDTLVYSDGHKQLLEDFKNKAKYARIGYLDTLIIHHFHGNKKSRKYDTRYKELVRHQFDPNTMLTTDSNGLLIPNKRFPKPLLRYIKHYFGERNEDSDK